MLEKDQIKLVEKSNSMFEELKKKAVITENKKQFNFKKATNVGKLYLLPKIHKRLSNVLGRPVISNPHRKSFEILKNLGEIPEDAIL